MYQIRNVAQTDLPVLAKLYSHYAINTTSTYCDHAVNSQYMRGLLCSTGHFCYVAIDDGGHICGYVHLSPQFCIHGKKYEVAIYLQPAHTGKGLGRHMVGYAEEQAREHGAKLMGVSVCTENEPSLRLFDSMGYRRVRVKQNAATKFDRPMHTQLFEKNL